jgi:hypothetical protein
MKPLNISEWITQVQLLLTNLEVDHPIFTELDRLAKQATLVSHAVDTTLLFFPAMSFTDLIAGLDRIHKLGSQLWNVSAEGDRTVRSTCHKLYQTIKNIKTCLEMGNVEPVKV